MEEKNITSFEGFDKNSHVNYGRKSLKCVHYPEGEGLKNEIFMECDTFPYGVENPHLSQNVILPNEPQYRFIPPNCLVPKASLLRDYNLIIALDTSILSLRNL